MSTKVTLPSGQMIQIDVEEITVEELKPLLEGLYPDVAGAIGTRLADGSIVFSRPVGGNKG